MASRKEAKEKARLERIEQERQRAAAAARKRRLGVFGGVIVIAVIAVVLIITVGGGNGHHPKGTTIGTGASTTNPLEIGLQTGASATKIGGEVDSELAGIKQSGMTLGNPQAKVTMLYFGDLQCSACQELSLDYLPSFIKSHVRTGLVKITYHSLCTASCNDSWGSTAAAEVAFNRQQIAAYAAGMQNKAWNFIERFYHEQGGEGTTYATDAWVTALGGQVSGLDLAQWATDRKLSSLAARITSDANLYTAYMTRLNQSTESSTPTLVMIGPKGIAAASASTSGMVSAYKSVL